MLCSAMDMAYFEMPASTVIELPPKKLLEGKRAHWDADTPTKFVNPWPSWRLYPAVDRIFPYVRLSLSNHLVCKLIVGRFSSQH